METGCLSHEIPAALDDALEDDGEDGSDAESLLAALEGGPGSSARGMTGTKLFCIVVWASGFATCA